MREGREVHNSTPRTGPLSSCSHAHAYEGERISCTTSLPASLLNPEVHALLPEVVRSMQHPNGTVLDRTKTEATAIRVPPMHASSEVVFSLDGPDVFVEVKLFYSAQVNRTFPGDVVGAERLDSLHHLDASEWLPAPFKSYPLDEPWLNNIVRQAARGGELDGIPADEWLRRHAERFLNEVCTEIRRKHDRACQVVSPR